MDRATRACPDWKAAIAVGTLVLAGATFGWAQDRPDGAEPVLFAVVTKVPKDRTVVTAQVSFDGSVSEAKLLAGEKILGNTIWRSLESCHSLKAEVRKVPEGFQILTVRALDASMLPMNLQSIAGDCLIKKAIEVAPLVD